MSAEGNEELLVAVSSATGIHEAVVRSIEAVDEAIIVSEAVGRTEITVSVTRVRSATSSRCT